MEALRPWSLESWQERPKPMSSLPRFRAFSWDHRWGWAEWTLKMGKSQPLHKGTVRVCAGSISWHCNPVRDKKHLMEERTWSYGLKLNTSSWVGVRVGWGEYDSGALKRSGCMMRFAHVWVAHIQRTTGTEPGQDMAPKTDISSMDFFWQGSTSRRFHNSTG